jgi:hypothetical protein
LAKVIVAGSYPPIPVPAAGATIDAVRRSLSEGYEVRVVSPRPSAAHFSGPLIGLIAGHRLNRLRRLTASTRLVFCLEAEVPFDPPGRPTRTTRWKALATAYLLARTFHRFDHTTLVVVGDTGGHEDAVRILEGAADIVVEDRREGQPPEGVTVRGPVEMRPQDLARRFVGGVARRAIRSMRR